MAVARHFWMPAGLEGLLEPDAVKAARPVLRGAGRSNASGLPGGFGFHPMLCYLDGSDGALDGILRPGNAGSNTAAQTSRPVSWSTTTVR